MTNGAKLENHPTGGTGSATTEEEPSPSGSSTGTPPNKYKEFDKTK
jgi:hypothetical protein